MKHGLTIAICLALLSSVTVAQDQSPDTILKAKGLTKVGNLYLVETDAKLPDKLKAERKSEAAYESYKKKKLDLESEIESAEGKIIRWTEQRKIILDAINNSDNGEERHNKLVGEDNNLVSQIRQGQQFLKDRKAALAKLVDPSKDLIAALSDLNNQMEDAAAQYQLLADDKDVQDALTKLNADQKPAKFKLGPSEQFSTNLPKLQRQLEAMKKNADAKPDAPKPAVGGGSQVPDTGSDVKMTLEIKGSIDGWDVVTISRDGLAWSHKTQTWPTTVTVNGQSWDPQKDQTFPNGGALAFLRNADFSRARASGRSGKGVVTIEPQDNSIIITFADLEPGPSPYSIKIAIPANKSTSIDPQ